MRKSVIRVIVIYALSLQPVPSQVFQELFDFVIGFKANIYFYKICTLKQTTIWKIPVNLHSFLNCLLRYVRDQILGSYKEQILVECDCSRLILSTNISIIKEFQHWILP